MATTNNSYMWVDEAEPITAETFSTSITDGPTNGTGYALYIRQDGVTQHYFTVPAGQEIWIDPPPPPPPPPVFDSLGDLLLHKYNKVKEVQV